MQELKKEKFRFIVIGGWAVYLWTKQHKSKDIDIILPELKDLEKIKQRYVLKKNDHLKKYEVLFEEIDLDIYVPYYSQLTLPIEDISKETTTIESFEVLIPEILLILKQGAEINRKECVKGQKDRIDIMTLLCYTPINLKKYRELLKKYNLLFYRHRLKEIIQSFKDIRFLNLSFKEYIQIKKKIVAEL